MPTHSSSNALAQCNCHDLNENSKTLVVYDHVECEGTQEKINRAFDILFNEILNQETVDNNVQLGVE